MAWYGPTFAIVAIFAATWTQEDGSDECKHSTDAVNNGRTGKVVEHITERAHHETVGCLVAKPASAPGPVSLDGVDEERDACTIHQIHRKLGAFRHGTTDDGGGSCTEDGFEDQKSFDGQFALVETEITPVGHADESCAFTSEHKSETYEKE